MRYLAVAIILCAVAFAGGYAAAWYIGGAADQQHFHGAAIRETEAEAAAYLASLPDGCEGNWHGIDHEKAYYVAFTCPRS